MGLKPANSWGLFKLTETIFQTKERFVFQITKSWYGSSYSFLFLNYPVLEPIDEAEQKIERRKHSGAAWGEEAKKDKRHICI